MSLFESTLLSFCKPQSKLDLPTLRQGSWERKNATELIENMTLASECHILNLYVVQLCLYTIIYHNYIYTIIQLCYVINLHVGIEFK